MTVKLDNKDCLPRFHAEKNTLDIYCNQDQDLAILSLTLTFPMKVELCSLYTSYGIDLALKPERMDWSSSRDAASGDYAFDGIHSATMDKGARCFHSDEEKDKKPFLKGFFKSPARAFGFYIMNRVEDSASNQMFLDRLKGFTLETENKDNITVQTYTDHETSGKKTYDIPFLPNHGSYSVSQSVKIKLPPVSDPVLTVCELRVFGEYFYGGPCLSDGHCKPNLTCKDYLCQCSTDYAYDDARMCCKKKKFSACIRTEECVSNFTCIDGKCQTEGDVRLSKMEETGDECPAGMFGPDCKEHCPANCENKFCHRTNGTCSSGCNVGSFGMNCEQKCPAGCMDSLCTIDKGTCYKGCKIGRYGETCQMECDSGCKDNTCNKSTGDCEKDSDTPIWIFVVVGIVILSLALVICLLVRKKKGKNDQQKQDAEH